MSVGAILSLGVLFVVLLLCSHFKRSNRRFYQELREQAEAKKREGSER